MHHDVLLSVVSEDECCIAWYMTQTAFLSRGMVSVTRCSVTSGTLWRVMGVTLCGV